MIDMALQEKLDHSGDFSGDVTRAEWEEFCDELQASLESDLK